jgi:ketosteroid isomerase-like protein
MGANPALNYTALLYIYSPVSEELCMSIDAKSVVRQFNERVIMRGDRTAFDALVDPGFVNRSAPRGAPDGPESMWSTFETVLRPALADLTVVIHDQIAEGDKVTTRKSISGTHNGVLMGIAATGRHIAIEVIDIVRVQDGRYVEHWGVNTLPAVLTQLRG